MVFYDNDRGDLWSHHNRPLYVTKKLKRKEAMLDLGSLLNIVSMSIPDAVDIS